MINKLLLLGKSLDTSKSYHIMQGLRFMLEMSITYLKHFGKYHN